MTVNKILKRKGSGVISIAPRSSVREAIETLVGQGVGSLLVMDGQGAVVGIISERDILRASARKFDDMASLTVADLMTRDVIIGCRDDSVEYVQRVMTESRIRHLPIYDGKDLVGIISIGDVVKASAEQAATEVRHLTSYITDQYPA